VHSAIGETHGAGSTPSALDIGGVQVLVGLKLAIEADGLCLSDRRRSDLAILVSMKFRAEVVQRRVPIPVLLSSAPCKGLGLAEAA
jgi:hypothetical protein